MKPLHVLFCAVLSLGFVQAARADVVPEDLVNLLAQQQLPVTTSPQSVISGEATAAVSQGVWQESQVLAFKQKFGYAPTVLPLTAIKQTGQADVLDITNSSAVFYLVVNYPPQGDARNTLAQSLHGLIDESFQEQLQGKNYQSLPEAIKKMWKVKLGLAEPAFASGYF